MNDELEKERELVRQLKRREEALEDEDKEYYELTKKSYKLRDDCIAEFRQDPPKRPNNNYKDTDDKSLHLSYMNSISMSHLTLTNLKKQSTILLQEMDQLNIYK